MFRNKNIQSIIKDRSIEYVSNKFNVSHNSAKLIYTHHYTTTQMCDKTTLKDYNDYVFGDLDWNHIEYLITL